MKIRIIDDLVPEDVAMLQALYSRSPASVDDHRRKVEEVGSGKFMGEFYVGYNHASIGDCGSTTIFIEGVSMLMAKAVQDNPLYSGQEASTRYMDFSNATFDSPGASSIDGRLIQRDWMQFYHHAYDIMLAHFREMYPYVPEQNARPGDDKKYDRALKARVFDVVRGFIPAGTHTNLSWHTNLRQARDKLRWLVAHPESQIAHAASELLGRLHVQYQSSGFDSKMSEEEWKWRRDVMDVFAYTFEDPGPVPLLSFRNFRWPNDEKMRKVLHSRPANVALPPIFGKLGTIESTFRLDFGSFRDLQRHRNGFVQMPLLTTKIGFNDWYYAQMPDGLRAEAKQFVAAQVERIEALRVTDVERQSYIAMGFDVGCRVVQTLPAFVYRVELRTAQTVHPTLRRIAQAEARLFTDQTGGVVQMHVDLSPDIWSTRRGAQTIEARPR